ncbi:MAG TPA: hypothetical protein VLS51_02715 [Propionibacteriaceae bacterium]|nr:hypothetical protein [Propionibacteriaceae bacterium]
MILKILVVIVLGAAVTWGGSPLVRLLFRLADRTERKDGHALGTTPEPGTAAEQRLLGTAEEVPPPAGTIEAAASRLRGGYWIGVLERLAIFSTIMAGYGGGLVVILGVKSLARYPELRAEDSRGAAERFIIGTFASSLVAAAGAGLALWVTSLW